MWQRRQGGVELRRLGHERYERYERFDWFDWFDHDVLWILVEVFVPDQRHLLQMCLLERHVRLR